jgi:hypothetical protein
MKRLFVRILLLATVILPSPAAFQRANAQPMGIYREVYLNITGSLVTNLTNQPAYPNSPGFDEVVTNLFETPVNWSDNYGTRVRALITPPSTGNYNFWIASDDYSELWLSTDDNPTNKQIIARMNGASGSRVYVLQTNQASLPISLNGGQRYYIEVLHKEGTGGDYLQVRWQLPGGTWETSNTNEPIPGFRLTPYGVPPPSVAVQPTNVTVIEGSTAQFNFRPARQGGVFYQWKRNGTNQPGAITTNLFFGPAGLTNNGDTFFCSLTNWWGATNTATVTLTVLPDTTPPVITSAGGLGDPQSITVVFSEAVDPATALALTNYAINHGVTVLAAIFGPDDRTIVLTTTPMSASIAYTLTVNNVRDRAIAPNTILPNSQQGFDTATRLLDVAFLKPRNENIGPSTRRGALVISEVMYHPADRVDGRDVEFIEIYNSLPWFEELGGWRITGAIDYTFPTNFVLGPRSFVVIARNPADVQTVHGITGVLGPWDGSLQNDSGTLRIVRDSGAVMFEMEYTGQPPYPVAADGAGHSLTLVRPSFGERDARAWGASDLVGGTPGTNEVLSAHPFAAVMINEFLAHTDLPDLDYIELFNYSTQAVNLSGCVLTDDPATNKFVLPTNTVIAAGGFLAFTETQLGFGLSAAGEDIFLKNPAGTRVIDAVRFGAQENGVATGRFPDGAARFSRLQDKTPGTNNAALRAPLVVIHELMHHPVSEDSNDEFVELFNPGSNTVNLAKWRIEGGVNFTFPAGTVLNPGGHLVVAKNAVRLRSNYPQLNTNNCLGDFSGTLANRGERVALSMPDEIISTNAQGRVTTNTIRIVVDEVTYFPGGRWGQWSDGGGSSLELRDWRADRRAASNWGDSDDTAKSAWVTVEATEMMTNGWDATSAYQLHVTLLGAGECLIDNVEVIPANVGTNLIANSTFESGTSGWVFQGNHNETGLETAEGYNSARSLRLRTTGRGDTGANRVRIQLPYTLTSGTVVTLRAKARWLKGNPNLLLRLRGNWVEAPGYTLTARNLGTPGLANTAAVTNTPPSIEDVTHWPVLPATNQPVLVTARVADPDGLATLLLKYRLDPALNYTGLAMTNNGAGIFSAVIPGQASNTFVAFYIQASDRLQPALPALFPNDAPLRECVVRWGDGTPGTLPVYRMWITRTNQDRWTLEEKMSNKPKDVTFVYGTNRVVYNAGAWFHGSPYHSPVYNTPTGTACDYDMGFPADDLLLGESDINLFRPGNGGGDATGQAEIHAYWFGGQFGIPHLFHRPVFLMVNGLQRGGSANIMHDAQQPNGDFVDQWYPEDAEGELHKIQTGFEFGNTAYGNGEQGYAVAGANFNRYYKNASGAFHMARYRSTLPLRSVSPSQQNDYTNLFTSLISATMTSAAINTPAYHSTLTNAFNVRQWYKTDVTQHLYNNNDSFSYGGGQNAFTYKPQRDGWNLLLWDVDFAFGGSGSDSNLFNIGGADHGPRNDHPPFSRLYWQTLVRAADTFMAPERSNPLIDARYSGLTGSGANAGSPNNIKTHISLKRATIYALLAATNNSPFDIQSNNGNDFPAADNLVTLSGRAPLEVATILVNGAAFPITWSTLTNWSITLALPGGSNSLSLTTLDQFGNVLTSRTDSINVTITPPNVPPQDSIVFNEIMFRPLVPDAEYLELFNRSTNYSYDLSNWRIEGLDYTFPEGTIFRPRTFILLAKDRTAFTNAYGTNITLFALYPGNLQAGGETLTLVKPGPGGTNDTVIDKVRYNNALPWPHGLPNMLSSVQLIDAAQDNSRVGNWAGLSPLSTNLTWKFASITTNVSTGTRLLMSLAEAGDVHVDDIALVQGTVPAVGTNLIRNGDFEMPLYDSPVVTNSWSIGTNYTATSISTETKHAGNGSLRMVSAGGTASTTNRMIYQNIFPPPATNLIHTLSYWYLPSTNGTSVTVRVQSTSLILTVNIRPSLTNSTPLLTPGTNNPFVAALPAFPNLWINEVQPSNLSGLTDNAGEREPWLELYNPGTNNVSLDGLWLATNYNSLAQWAFPTGVVIGPQQFKVIFADAQPAQSTNGEIHTSFRLAPGSGSVALSRQHLADMQVIDYVNYIAGADRSFGSYPDGQPFDRQEFYFVTPAATNNGVLPPVALFINEWLADNLVTLADPADGQFEDWFEIYNPGTNDVALGGYFLTDSLTNKFKYQIPLGYFVPARGHLLVWADGEPGQNSPARPDLHADFSLSKSGEEIGLFTPDGLQVDAVVFALQTTDISQGRFPDGTANVLLMTNRTPRAANYYPLPNSAPHIAALADRTALEGELITFTAAATDSDVPAQQITWSLDPGAPTNAAINPATGVFAWVPGENNGGAASQIIVRATDNGTPSLSDARAFNVTVLESNLPPAISTGGDRVVNEGATLAFNVTATDADAPAQNLMFSVENLPPGAAFNTNSGAFAWTPSEAQGPGVYTVTVHVTDDGVPPLQDQAAITITVHESNQPPVLASISNRTVNVGESLSFSLAASDADLPPQSLAFDLVMPVPVGALLNPTSGQFTWTANVTGTNTFSVRVTDNAVPSLQDIRTFDVVVIEPLQIKGVILTNGVVALEWFSIPGREYRVEFKDNLAMPAWTPLGSNVLAAGASAAITDAVGTNTQRIYRVQVLP